MDIDAQKRQAAKRALDYVRPGMKLGLGTGSTAEKFVDLLGAKVSEGLDVVCVPTSEATRLQAEGLGIPLTTLEQDPELDLTIDGADELDERLQLIKGGGGAHMREKIAAAASHRMVVIADESKRVKILGRFPLPVEIAAFGWRATLSKVSDCAAMNGARGPVTLRGSQADPFVTDNGNYILGCAFGEIEDAAKVAMELSLIPGVVEHGLFIGLAHAAVVAGASGVDIMGETP